MKKIILKINPNIFRLKSEQNGEVFIIRPLPNIKNIKESIVSYKTIFNKITYKWEYRHMCFALINDELKIFDFSKQVYKLFSEDSEFNTPLLFMTDSDKAIKVTVGVKCVGCGLNFLDNKYEIISGDEFGFDNTEEKRNYIKNLLETTKLDLSEALETTKLDLSEALEI